MENVDITVQPRDPAGSRAARRLRREGLIPGILYGHGQAATPFAVEPHVMREAVSTDAGMHAVLSVTFDGVKGKRQAIIKEVTLHPTRSFATHVDLQEIRLDETIESVVAVSFEGESKGVKVGGVLDESLREVSVKGRVTEIPEHLVLDISDLDINHTARVSDLQVPGGITVLDDPEQVLCSVLPPRKIEVEVEEAAAPEAVAEIAPEESED
jgi:large subunit ribosomal protein L25